MCTFKDVDDAVDALSSRWTARYPYYPCCGSGIVDIVFWMLIVEDVIVTLFS